jgi:hypothetical protein
MYFDGSLMLQGAGARVVLVSPSGNQMRYVLCLNFEGATNNIVEYEAPAPWAMNHSHPWG